MLTTNMSIPTSKIFKQFNKTTVLVVGDVMGDTYLFGNVDRISPEAPVPVVNVHSRESRLGGAANVAVNIKELGGEPIICSMIGSDETGSRFINLLKANNLNTGYIVKNSERITTEKSRVLSRSHQMLRFDEEIKTEINKNEETQLIESIEKVFADHKIDTVILQDYNKGVLTPRIITTVMDRCVQDDIPTAVDPKEHNFFAYKNATLFKPNLKEVKDALGLTMDASLDTLLPAHNKLREKLNHNITLITLSEKGIFIADKTDHEIIPATVRNVSDVSGAGDTVISVAALCLAQNLNKKTLAVLSNIAGGLACEYVGVAAINKEIFLENVRKVSVH